MTLREKVDELLQKAGVSHATGAKVVLVNGETVIVASDNHPVLDRPMEEVSDVKLTRTAEGG